ncbi:MAG: hypothetical protein K1X75_07685 [Leptospirales bacterium]|nr:hypothetical protein [Leptospirales bacterium]
MSLRGATVYFLGIGGSGMSPLARFAARAGCRVSGADPGIGPELQRNLAQEGIAAFRDHDAARIEGADIVVYSSAIGREHPDRARAEQLAASGALRLMHRFDFLSETMSDARAAFCVAGTHGKTSTTSMLGWLLLELGADPHILAGGKPLYLPEGFRYGGGDACVYETDESDASFLRAAAGLRLCLNIDADHLETYGDLKGLCRAFERFIGEAQLCALNLADDELRGIASGMSGNPALVRFAALDRENSATLSASEQALLDYRGVFSGKGYELEVFCKGVSCGSFELRLPGKHFASNALGALALLDAAVKRGFLSLPHYSVGRALQSLGSFPGVSRRMELIGRWRGAPVYDDYGHHPTELRAVLSALRPLTAVGGKLVALFQPHRYTRTGRLAAEFAAALALADRVVLLPIYAAGESPLPEADERTIARHLQALDPQRSAECIDPRQLPELGATLQSGDVLAALGAGSISQLIRAAIS